MTLMIINRCKNHANRKGNEQNKIKICKISGIWRKTKSGEVTPDRHNAGVRNKKQNKSDGIVPIIRPIKGKWSNVGLFAHAAPQSVPSIVGYAGAAAAKLPAYIIAALQNVQLFAY